MLHSEAMEVLGISWSTLSRWVKQGKIRFSHYKIRGRMGKRNYFDEDVHALVGRKFQKENRVAAYFRINAKNKDARAKMVEQKALVKAWCAARGITIDLQVEDVASGVDYGVEQRPGLHKILQLLINNKLDAVVVESGDRLTRFGLEIYEVLFSYYGVSLLIVNKAIIDEYYQNEQTEDITKLLAAAKVQRIK